jgi:hypothetical protein
MIKFKDKNDELIKGSSLKEVVEDLRNGSRMASHEDLPTYMKGFSEREKIYSGSDVRYDTIENFVADLVTCGFWKRVN